MKSLSMSFWIVLLNSLGCSISICKLDLQESPSLARLSVTKFFPRGTCRIRHWPSHWRILCVLLRIVIPDSFPSLLVRRLTISRLSVWIVALLKPFSSKMMIPSMIPQSSVSNGLHLPKKRLNPETQLPSLLRITPPAAAWPVFLATAHQ